MVKVIAAAGDTVRPGQALAECRRARERVRTYPQVGQDTANRGELGDGAQIEKYGLPDSLEAMLSTITSHAICNE